MTIKEAIERLKKRICCEKPIQHFCTDNCMHGVDECEVSMSIEALEKQLPKKLFVEKVEATKNYYCPCCTEEIMQIGFAYIKRQVQIPGRPQYCYNCGQRLDWEEEQNGIV